MKKHLTWGETHREHGVMFTAYITFGAYVALCKRLVDEAELPGDPAPSERPEGVCRACWKRYRRDMEIEAVLS